MGSLRMEVCLGRNLHIRDWRLGIPRLVMTLVQVTVVLVKWDILWFSGHHIDIIGLHRTSLGHHGTSQDKGQFLPLQCWAGWGWTEEVLDEEERRVALTRKLGRWVGSRSLRWLPESWRRTRTWRTCRPTRTWRWVQTCRTAARKDWHRRGCRLGTRAVSSPLAGSSSALCTRRLATSYLRRNGMRMTKRANEWKMRKKRKNMRRKFQNKQNTHHRRCRFSLAEVDTWRHKS